MAYLSFSLIFIRIINLIVNIIFRIIGTVIIAISWSIRSASTQHWHRIIIIMVIIIFTSSFLHLCYSFVHVSWGGSRTAATFKVELFVIIVKGFQLLTIITESSTLDIAAVLDLPLGWPLELWKVLSTWGANQKRVWDLLFLMIWNIGLRFCLSHNNVILQ